MPLELPSIHNEHDSQMRFLVYRSAILTSHPYQIFAVDMAFPKC
jgi:hypothetical protein